MQAIILAAGKGKRMGKLTLKTPKPLLKIDGKTVLEQKIEALPKTIREIIIVVGHLKGKIEKTLGGEVDGRKIIYVPQKKLNGTGPALFITQKFLKDKFIVLMGDDLYAKKDLAKCCKADLAVMVAKTKNQSRGAKVLIKKRNLESIEENQILNSGDWQNTGVYILNKKIFKYPLVKIENGEFGLPQTISLMAKDFPIKVIKTTFWQRITNPDDLKPFKK